MPPLRPLPAAAVLALLMTARSLAAAGETPADAAAVHAAFLHAEIEAARSRELYLVLDPAAGRLEVRAEGQALLALPVERAVLAHADRGATPSWPALSFRLAGEPPAVRRPVLTPPDGSAAAAPAPPPAPGERLDFRARQRRELLDRAPASYLLRFEPALEVAVEGDGAAAPGTGGWRETRARLAARFGAPRPPDRLRLVLPADAARRLCLTLGPSMRLLVAPPAG